MSKVSIVMARHCFSPGYGLVPNSVPEEEHQRGNQQGTGAAFRATGETVRFATRTMIIAELHTRTLQGGIILLSQRRL